MGMCDRALKLAHAIDIKRRSASEATFSRAAVMGVALGTMSTISRVLLVLALVMVLGGTMFLLTWEIPAPTARIERVIPDDKLPR
jgi:hypothetical protein